MQLFWAQVHASWTLLLLLVPNLLFWENVASNLNCGIVNVHCKVSTGDLLGQMQNISECHNIIAAKTYRKFNKLYGEAWGFRYTARPVCHTSSLPLPNNKKEATQTEPATLLNMMISMLDSWYYPLQNVLLELDAFPVSHEDIKSKIRVIEEARAELLESVKTVLSKAYPEVEENKDFPIWREVRELQSADEKTRLLAFYRLFYCLYTDCKKIVTYVKVLRCRMEPSRC